MMRLITEISHDIKVIGEGKTPEFDYIEGVFSTAEAMNNNQRKYRKSTLEREVSTIMEKVQNKCLWGELGHPPGPEINPERICILTLSLVNFNSFSAFWIASSTLAPSTSIFNRFLMVILLG